MRSAPGVHQTLADSIALLLDLLEGMAQEFLEANNRTDGVANDQRIATVDRFVLDEGERKLLLREVLRGAVMNINHLAREVHCRRSSRSMNMDSMTSGPGERELTGQVTSLLERTYAALARFPSSQPGDPEFLQLGIEILKACTIGQGKTVNARYARTWYGWVPLQRHEFHKRLFQNCFQRLLGWTSWRSSKADFRWVWWDPGQKELEKYKERRGFLRWVPKCFRSYEFTTADAIWNPGPPYPAPAEKAAERLCPGRNTPTQNMCRAVLKSSEIRGSPNISSSQMSMSDHSQLSPMASTLLDRRLEGNSTTDTIHIRDLRILYDHGGMPLPLNHSIYVRRGNCMVLLFPNRNQMLRQNLSMPCLLSTGTAPSRLVDRSEGFYTAQNLRPREVASGSIQKRPRALAYQMWSARMELQTSRCIRYNQGPLLGPPGSPESGLLGSFSSERTALLEMVPRFIGRRTANPSSDATSHGVSMKQHSDHDRRQMSDERAQDSEAERRRFKQQPRVDNSSCRSAEGRDLGPEAACPGGVQSPPRSDRVERARKLHKVNNSTKLQKKHQSKARHQAPRKVPLRRLSTWESRLAHDLNRKLKWLVEQLSPGRRPFHFALLANHWLNRETWVVLDPISRVPIEARRLWGDPRFNSPYPMPHWEPRPKYPESPCKTANRPHLISWRVAVNRNRRASGLRDVVKSAALLEGSDEPPDGKVDPASWILRRPPQGFAMSTTQQDAYYEGGAGWQETLSDWQRVSRGYRIRKAIYEGRANRTRMKEITVGLTRYFQAITNEALNTHQKEAA
ncbi:hypothetical protein CNMCM6106_002235 [Aspergillus hiratsukae]|uniref:Uncharacterized protein n=1 Tax=Aspergillus hiratsukae TaxID=1194566 RepID=A0A8H6UJH6_9EURO|nr:hypothetical protein CNMCM6106_002235 [Aspergillus hiratsukae]